MKNEIVLFENQNIKLEVNLQDETVWLNTKQIAELFDRDYKTIRKHINNALNEELQNEVVVAKFATTAKDNKNYQVEYYNLDVILSVGYRIKSSKGVTFRKWANKILKEHLIKGYTVNQERLNYLEKTIKLIIIADRIEEKLQGTEAQDIIKVINNYSNALTLLDDYDHKTIIKPKGTINNNIITYEDCIEIINKLRFHNDSNLFALERNEGLKEIIGTIYQTFSGNDLYPTTEEKAANFLYLIIKNHTFIDGN